MKNDDESSVNHDDEGGADGVRVAPIAAQAGVLVAMTANQSIHARKLIIRTCNDWVWKEQTGSLRHPIQLWQ